MIDELSWILLEFEHISTVRKFYKVKYQQFKKF